MALRGETARNVVSDNRFDTLAHAIAQAEVAVACHRHPDVSSDLKA
jgi:hypothetical protein